MTKLRLPNLNSWVTTLILVSIGLHGLVLALPMPSLIEEKAEPPDPPDPDVIQVVTLPKLAKAPDSSEPPLPDPPEPLPEEVPFLEEPVEDVVLAEPEILDEIEPELFEDEIEPEDSPAVDEGGLEEQSPETPLGETEDGEKYGEYNGEQVDQFDFTISAAWEPQVRAEFPISDDETVGFLKNKDLEISLQPFRPSTCLPDDPSGEVTVGIVLDAEDDLLGDPTLLSHTGYPDLDDEIIEFARTINYLQKQSPGVIKPYWLSLQIEYEPCDRT